MTCCELVALIFSTRDTILRRIGWSIYCIAHRQQQAVACRDEPTLTLSDHDKNFKWLWWVLWMVVLLYPNNNINNRLKCLKYPMYSACFHTWFFSVSSVFLLAGRSKVWNKQDAQLSEHLTTRVRSRKHCCSCIYMKPLKKSEMSIRLWWNNTICE